MSNKKQEFITSTATSNAEWVAQQVIANFSEKQFMELQACFYKLNESLYKGWSQEMTFSELKEAVDKVAELSEIQ